MDGMNVPRFGSLQLELFDFLPFALHLSSSASLVPLSVLQAVVLFICNTLTCMQNFLQPINLKVAVS